MKRNPMKGWLGSVLAAVLAAACAGGDNGGIDGTGATNSVSYGTITGFGSVWVNGVRFNVDNATIRLDDGAVRQADLRIGMVVRVDGSIDTSTAATVTVDSALKGRVEQVVDASSFVVMGQRVVVDNLTRFETAFAPAVGDIVEVHGLPTADGVVTAGYVQKLAALPSPPFAVKGFVKSHDPANTRFTVGTLVVNYAGANVSDLPAGSWDGRVVEVKGSACAGNPVCGTLTATRVRPTGAALASAPKAELEGFVTALAGSTGFTLGATPVVVTGTTVYEGGTLADIAVGTKLEVQGRVDNGTLTATKVEFSDNIRLQGVVGSVDVTAGTVTVAGLPGVVVRVNTATRLEGAARLADLVPGQRIEIEARAGAGSVLATEIKYESGTETRVTLQAPVAAVGTNTITLQGVVIDLSGIGQFQGRDEATIDRAAFVAAAQVGTLVNARGTLSGSSVVWSRLQLED